VLAHGKFAATKIASDQVLMGALDTNGGELLQIQATHLGKGGCDQRHNVLIQIGTATYSNADPSCGLDIASLGARIGERFAGSFDGVVRTGANPSTKRLKVTFDVAIR
jgi:hypothetical protein